MSSDPFVSTKYTTATTIQDFFFPTQTLYKTFILTLSPNMKSEQPTRSQTRLVTMVPKTELVPSTVKVNFTMLYEPCYTLYTMDELFTSETFPVTITWNSLVKKNVWNEMGRHIVSPDV